MPAPRFDYVAPTTVEGAVAALLEGGRNARVMAGGTDLLVKIRHRMLFPERIVSLKRIPGLDAITFDKRAGLTTGPVKKMTCLFSSVSTISPKGS